MLNTDPHGFLYRIVAGVAGLAIIGFGVGPLLHGGDLFGTNWFGELVFAPLAIVLGLIPSLRRSPRLPFDLLSESQDGMPARFDRGTDRIHGTGKDLQN